MALGVIDIANTQYRTTRTADAQCAELLRKLGYKVRYLAARLAIARSLSLDSPLLTTADDDDDAAIPIRGQQLFGDGSDPAAWLALITQRSNRPDLTKKDFQALVSAHWRRGADLLTHDWEEAEGNLGAFVSHLADLASLTSNDEWQRGSEGDHGPSPAVTVPVILPVGEVAEDAQTGEPVAFPLNGAGGSPHIAVMGGVGSGKTRTAVEMLRRFSLIGTVPVLAFDFKGDLAETLAPYFDAEILHPPRHPVPLDVLRTAAADETGLRETAGRIRESIAHVKTSRLGGVQSDALREAVLQVLRTRRSDRPATISDIARALTTEYQHRDRKPDELTATLNELTQFTLFEPRLAPAEFFSRSWIIRLPQDGTMEVRRLIINLTLDALDRWLNSQEDSPLTEGRRAVRHVCLLDEAHVVLATRLPALGNLVRMSRSKGGVVVLASQSPDDFEGDQDDFLDNMGLTLAFNTQAKPGPTRRVFGAGYSLTDLAVGEALCRIRTEAKTRRIVAWQA